MMLRIVSSGDVLGMYLVQLDVVLVQEADPDRPSSEVYENARGLIVESLPDSTIGAVAPVAARLANDKDQFGVVMDHVRRTGRLSGVNPILYEVERR